MAANQDIELALEFNESSGNAADASHNAYTFTNNGSVAYSSGKLGNCVTFDSSSKYFEKSSTTNLNPGSGPWSICGWVQIHDKSNTFQMIFSKDDNNTQRSFQLWYYATADRFYLNSYRSGSPDFVQAATFGSPTLDTWYWIEAGYDGTNVYIHVNNGTKDTAAASGATDSTTAAFTIGNTADHGSNNFNGKTDQLVFRKGSNFDSSACAEIYNGGTGLAFASWSIPVSDFVVDTFTGSDGTAITSHTGETGATWNYWSTFSGGSDAIKIVSNSMRGDAAHSAAYASGTSNSADQEITAHLLVHGTPTIASASVMARISNTANATCYKLSYRNDTNLWQLDKFVAGSQTLLGTSAQVLTADQSYKLKLKCVGTSISAEVDDVQVIAATDSGIAGGSGDKFGIAFVGSSLSDANSMRLLDVDAAGDSSAGLVQGAASYVSNGFTAISVIATAPTGGAGGYTYQWQRKTGAGSFSNVSSATSLTLNDSGLSRATIYVYRCKQTDTGSTVVYTNELTARTSKYQVVCDGASNTLGGQDSAHSWPHYMSLILTEDFQVSNVGRGGGSAGFVLADLSSSDSLYNAANTANIYVANGDMASNSLLVGDGVSQGYADYKAVCDNRAVNGWLIVAATSTMRGGDDDGHNSDRATLYQMIRDNYRTFANSLCDVAVNGQSELTGDTTWYSTDQHHWSAALHAEIGPMFGTAVGNSLIDDIGSSGSGGLIVSAGMAGGFQRS